MSRRVRVEHSKLLGEHREPECTRRPVRASDRTTRVAARQVRGPTRRGTAVKINARASPVRAGGPFRNVRGHEPRIHGPVDPLRGTLDRMRGTANPLRGPVNQLHGGVPRPRGGDPRPRGADPRPRGRNAHQRGEAGPIQGAIRTSLVRARHGQNATGCSPASTTQPGGRRPLRLLLPEHSVWADAARSPWNGMPQYLGSRSTDP